MIFLNVVKNVNVPFMFRKKVSKSGTRKSKILLRWCQSVKKFPISSSSGIKHVDGMFAGHVSQVVYFQGR